ncbi:B12-binding domain-containing radical SAM protein [Pseudothermotoga lettingae]|uniref:Radical SAM domain protein n=1 Tax=Pseudothermotoga lettingae (strain ATCC BAA-301 / DSM 14385 / NBRC 107922 / TMO) TaxID=416591 RepID=A8F7Z2_PSELT|nr:radical SAM protein [Pseudothermotoga lettingae]ABV34276.1 Radical SAM domain protein [Pseudothermotoga lettingae TMO]GLI48779.1 B12-binding domain-containing radical SAM protein [Pseudothermotoga lettingae TMO]
MRILLVNPSNKGYYYRLGAVYPPLGLFYISSTLKKIGHSVRVIDMNVEPFDWRNFDYSSFDVVGVSTDTVRFPLAKQICQVVKSQGVITVMGGPHATAEYEKILTDGICDYVVLGEGEVVLPKLLEALKNNERKPDLSGLCYIENGTIVSKKPEFVEDLDLLPFPDRENFTAYRTMFDKKMATSVITSRGCPFNCEFCSASQFMGMRIRKRSVENVVEELKILKKMNYGSVIFFDDNFTIDKTRTIKLCEQMLKENLNFSWWAFSRADELLGKEDLVEAMSKAGCKMLFIGFESAEDEILQEYNKKLSSSIAFDVAKLLKKYKIDLFASFIMGALNDTKESIKKTIKFAKKLGAEIVQFSIMTPYPGTKLYEKLKSKITVKDLSMFDGTNLVFQHPKFSPDELKKLFFKAYYSIYSTPRLIFKRGIPFLIKLLSTGQQAAYSM